MTQTEFKAGAADLGVTLKDEELDAEFALMDTNKSGVVVFDEFCQWVAKNQCQVGLVSTPEDSLEASRARLAAKPAAPEEPKAAATTAAATDDTPKAADTPDTVVAKAEEPSAATTTDAPAATEALPASQPEPEAPAAAAE